jgi:putative colanic acid biosynthesis UDP-glucose lipid carrier transferase
MDLPPGMAAQTIRQTHSALPTIQHLCDGLAVCCTLPVAQWLLFQPLNDRTWVAGFAAAFMFFVVAELLGLYRLFRGRTPDVEIVAICLAWSTTLLLLAGFGFATRMGETFARSSVLVWFLLGGLFLAFARMIVRAFGQYLMRQDGNRRRCAIAGMNPLGLQVARNTVTSAESGFDLIGFYDDRDRSRLIDSDSDLPSYQGGIQSMIQLAKEGKLDTVFVTLPMRAENRIREILKGLGDTTAAVYIVPDFFVFELMHSRWSEVGGLPVVSVFETPVYGVDGWLKRFVDVTLSGVGLLAIAPIMLMIALRIKLESAGPVFFRQKRYGLNGKEIWVWKFRSMTTCDNGPSVQQATKGDARITPFGGFLRRTSLDELPQLFNVLGGTMSLVGPRPHASAHNEHYRKLITSYMMRHKVKPGITGLAQVNGCRGETETVEKMMARVDYDHQYIREWSVWLDMKILFGTLTVFWKQENAY